MKIDILFLGPNAEAEFKAFNVAMRARTLAMRGSDLEDEARANADVDTQAEAAKKAEEELAQTIIHGAKEVPCGRVEFPAQYSRGWTLMEYYLGENDIYWFWRKLEDEEEGVIRIGHNGILPW